MDVADRRPPTRTEKVLSALAVAAALVAFLWFSLSSIGLEMDFSTLLPYRSRLWQGFLSTLLISVGSLAASLLIGGLTALGQKSRLLVLQYACRVYVQIIRGTPMLVQIYFFYYIIGTAWGIDNRYVAGIAILSVFEGAYISEIVRGGLESIDRQQYEIARAIGLSPRKTLRLVTFPILMARVLPALTGQFASIIKDSSLLSVIAVIEMTQTIQEISSENFRIFENYIAVGVLYFVLTFSVSVLSRRLERRFRHEDRTAGDHPAL